MQPDAGLRIQALVAQRPDDEAALLPAILARACVDVLQVADAGLSLIAGRFRLPIGASSDTASFAESLQFTLGTGPCLESAARGEPIAAAMPLIERRWPLLANELAAETPYQAIVSLPLVLDGGAGAIDLYFSDAASFRAISFADALDAAGAVAAILRADAALTAALEADDEGRQPTFLDRDPARGRGKVWIAAGMLMARTSESSRDSLARLRAYAYAEGRTLDAVAVALVDGALGPDAVLD